MLGAGSDADEKTLVAMNTLQTLESLLRSVSSAPPIVAQLETILLPVLAITMQHEMIELYDDLFELAHSITYFQRTVTLPMWQFFEQLHAMIKGSGIDFIAEAINVIDNFVIFGGDYLANHDGYKLMLLDVFETAMQASQLGAADRVSACKLAGEVLLCLRGNLDAVSRGSLQSSFELQEPFPDAVSCLQHVESYVVRAMSIVTRENSREEPIVTQELHANALELVVTAVYYNPGLTLSILSKHNLVEAFFKQWLGKMSLFTRVYDRKVAILAITGLLTNLAYQMAGMPGLADQLLQAALTLFEGLPQAIESECQLGWSIR